MAVHESVLLEEAVLWLEPAPGKVILDGTVGFAGHAKAWLEQSGPDGRVIGLDRDEDALGAARETLAPYGERAMLIHEDFRNFPAALKRAGVSRVDGMLLDLGVSSAQLDRAERGFSFSQDGPLDMRMDRRAELTAFDIVNGFPKKDLLDILWNYGEERFARRIVDKIEEARSKRSIATTRELASLIFQAVPKPYRYGRIHPATRSFQALRIAVNQEMEALETFLAHAADYLNEGGRIVLISFHSLEDRQVKTRFRSLQSEGRGRVLTKKPAMASEAEAARNPRARSAKMRVFQMGEGVR